MITAVVILLNIFEFDSNLFIPSRLAYSQDGKAGAIRDAGGSFSKKEAADEERYFHKMVRMILFTSH